jgi:acyl carrier protein
MTRQEISAVIQGNMRMIIPGVDGQEIVDAKSMRDYGADSLMMVEVVSRSMKQLKIKVPRARLVPVTNLKELIDVFEEEGAKAAALK